MKRSDVVKSMASELIMETLDLIPGGVSFDRAQQICDMILTKLEKVDGMLPPLQDHKRPDNKKEFVYSTKYPSLLYGYVDVDSEGCPDFGKGTQMVAVESRWDDETT